MGTRASVRVGSLFAGIEGFGLAFTRAGFTLAWSVEVDASCRKVIEHHFPDVPIFDDVRTVHGRSACQEDGCELCLPAVDVLVGGWPCQPFSVAGRRRGTDDERDLWPEFARLIGELRPAWMVGENVPGLLSIEQGQVWGRTITDLDDLGYGVAWRVCDAQHFGVPQRRRRIFVVGCLGDVTGPAKVLFDEPGGEGDFAAGGEAGEDVAGPLGNGSGDSRRGYRNDLDTHGAYIVSAPVTASWDNATASPESSRRSPLITHALSSEGADASEDGTGRGTPLIAFQNGQDFIAEEDLSQPVTGSHGQPPPIAFAQNQRGEVRDLGDTMSQLTTGGGKPGEGYPAIAFDPLNQTVEDGVTPSLRAGEGAGAFGDSVHVATPMAVRRLMPIECERLQGFPDNWTDIAGSSDSTRYRQLGNAVAIPVVEWIANRIRMVNGG